MNFSYYKNNLNFLQDNIDSNVLNHKNNWIYSFTENFFAFSYKVNYFLYENNPYQDNFNLKNKIIWSKSICNFECNLIYSVLLDQIYFLSIFMLPFLDNFYNHLINTFEINSILIEHPEYYFIYKYYLIFFYKNFFTNFYLSIFLLNVNESYISLTSIFFHFIFVFAIVIFLLISYFNYYINYNTSENIIDHDYLSYNTTIESEEEIGSMDDMLLTSVILLYVFLWFFWIYSWCSISINPQLIMTLYLFPFIYFIIFCIPFSLLYDYGSYFLTYLNGVGKSSIISIELLFDYIACSIFFLRLMVQNVRLVFMLFTYMELHEMIFNIDFLDSLIPAIENLYLLEFLLFLRFDESFSLAINGPIMIGKWLYELFHTYFMVTFQFIAFFAMIFWLFLFLYTMFVSETNENYFSLKRNNFKKNNKNKINLKLL